MKNIKRARLILSVLLTVLSVNSAPSFALSSSEWAYRHTLLHNPSRSNARAVASSIKIEGVDSSKEFLDTIAELIVRDSQNNETSKATPILLQILRRSKRSEERTFYRYYELLSELTSDRKKYDLGKLDSKVQRDIRVMKYKAKSMPQYKMGDTSLEEVAASYIEQSNLALSENKNGNALASVHPEMSLDEIYDHLGKPTSASIKKINAARLNIIYLWLHYLGQGELSFRLKGTQWRLASVSIPGLEPESSDSEPQSGSAVSALQGSDLVYTTLMHGSIFHLQTTIKGLYKHSEIDVGILDTVAEMLATNYMNVEGRLEVDTYAWMCKLLANKGGPRYTGVLDHVRNTSNQNRIKKNAEPATEAVPGIPLERYQMGSLDLAEMKARYPLPTL